MATIAPTALMNRIYRRQRHVYDLTRKYYLLGRDQLIERLAPRPGDRVLEIGCGTGRNLIVAAERYPGVRFFGIDVSTEMLASASHAIAAAELSPRIRLAHADATDFDPAALFGLAQFERIFISYSLSMIPRWDEAINRTVAALGPGGELHIVDFGTLEDLPRAFDAVLRWWLALFHVSPRRRLELWLTLRADQVGASLAVEHPYRTYVQMARLTMPL